MSKIVHMVLRFRIQRIYRISVFREGTENITVSFYETEKRMAWEQLFIETKEKLGKNA